MTAAEVVPADVYVTDTAVELLPASATRTPAWHAARNAGVGSSDIAAILGLSPWESPFSLWHRKAGTIGEQDDNNAMEWGRDLEAVVANRYQREHPDTILAECGLVAHAERRWQLATPDRIRWTIGADSRPAGLVEIKTDARLDGWGEHGSDDIGPYYRAQVLWQADICGFDEGDVAALLMGRYYREYTIRAQPGELEFMRDRARQFLDSVAAGQAPSIDGHSATADVLKKLHPDVDDVEVPVPSGVAEEYAAACTAYSDAKTRKAAAENQVRATLGRGRYATFGGQRVATRTVYDRKGYTVAPTTIDRLTPAKTREDTE